MADRKPPSGPSGGDDKPYKVGKGKPPVEHQFKAGQKPPPGSGRPKGSKSRSNLEKLLDEKVPVGTDRLGRPIYRKLGDVKDRVLVKMAIEERNLAAIKVLNEYQLKQMALRARGGPDPETLRQEREEQAEKDRLAKKLRAGIVDILEREARVKKATAPRMTWRDGKPVPWEAATAPDAASDAGDLGSG